MTDQNNPKKARRTCKNQAKKASKNLLKRRQNKKRRRKNSQNCQAPKSRPHRSKRAARYRSKPSKVSINDQISTEGSENEAEFTKERSPDASLMGFGVVVQGLSVLDMTKQGGLAGGFACASELKAPEPQGLQAPRFF